jgi:hypothetical protein
LSGPGVGQRYTPDGQSEDLHREGITGPLRGVLGRNCLGRLDESEFAYALGCRISLEASLDSARIGVRFTEQPAKEEAMTHTYHWFVDDKRRGS